MLSRQTHSEHALLVNLQSRAIKVPLLVLYTSGSKMEPQPLFTNTHTFTSPPLSQFKFGLRHHPVSLCTVLLELQPPEWIECPGSATTTTILLPPRSRLFLEYHSLFLSNWLFEFQALWAVCISPKFLFPTVFFSRFRQMVKFQFSFLYYHLKKWV